MPFHQSKLQRRGQYTLLPIDGYMLNTIELSHHGAPALTFVNASSAQATIRFETARITVQRGSIHHAVQWRPGKSFTASELYPFVDLLGLYIEEATASSTGILQIILAGDATITAIPEMYEGWHFAMPGLTLHGGDGRLI